LWWSASGRPPAPLGPAATSDDQGGGAIGYGRQYVRPC
jgi:hypothetical protein